MEKKQADDLAKAKQDGMSLKDSLRTPLEIFRDEMMKVQQLSNVGAIDNETRTRAQQKNREELLNAANTDAKRKEIHDAEQRRLDALVAAGKLTPEAAQRAMTAVSALMDEAAARAAAAGEQMTKMTAEGTFDGSRWDAC